MKTETKNTLLAYEQPESYEIKVRTHRVFCVSQDGIDDIEGDDVINQNSDWGL